MLLQDFDYPLPEHLIADRPPEHRPQSRLMVIRRSTQSIEHTHFYDLPHYLESGDLVARNDTRVIPARLYGLKRGGGAQIEIVLLEHKGSGVWECLAQRANRLGKGTVIDFDSDGCCEVTEVLEDGRFLLRFEVNLDWEEFLRRRGEIPLPPYIQKKREKLTPEERQRLRELDLERYQTLYAASPGSAAAPTAGLHFTPELMETLEAKGVSSASVTLHVGLDTFSPVRVDRLEDHRMYTEWCFCPPASRERILATQQAGGRVVAVGTTSCRTLESYARSGWPDEPLRTNLFLKPGDDFHAIGGLITNFHLPKSTLLMLVSAFMGNDLRVRAYREAVDQGYRFYSYGDAMLIL